MKKSLSIQDFYTQKAKEENYPARSVYKLKEIDERFKVLKVGDRVLDLGAAPGSWFLYACQKTGKKGKVVGIDKQDLRIPLPNNGFFLKKDILSPDIFGLDFLQAKFGLVLSDISPQTTGLTAKDVAASLSLGERAFFIAKKTLALGGNFVCKIFEGSESQDFFQEIKNNFKIVKRFRPKATPKGSREFYVVAKTFLH